MKPMPKSAAGYRTIPIPVDVVSRIKNYLEKRDKRSILLFPSSSGGVMSQTSFRHFWEKIIKAVEKNIPQGDHIKIFNVNNDITPHTFRHTYATMLFYAGVDIKTAQYLMGHSSIQVTMDIYTHLDKEQINASAGKLENYVVQLKDMIVSAEFDNNNPVKIQSV